MSLQTSSNMLVSGISMVTCRPPPIKLFLKKMSLITCTLAWLCAVLMLPFAILWWACESRHTTINKLRSWGYTWKEIGDRYNVSPSTARRWSLASA